MKRTEFKEGETSLQKRYFIGICIILVIIASVSKSNNFCFQLMTETIGGIIKMIEAKCDEQRSE